MNQALRQRAQFFLRVLHGNCPQCGNGALFERRTRLRERCPSCGLVFRREQGSMIGSMYLSAIASEIFAAAVAVSMFLFTDWSLPVALSVGVALVLAFAAWFLPYSMSLWVAVEYATDVGNGEWWAKPR